MDFSGNWAKRPAPEVQGKGTLRKPGHPMDGRRAMLLIQIDRDTIKAQFDETVVAGKHNPFAYGWHCFSKAEFEIEPADDGKVNRAAFKIERSGTPTA